MPEQTHWQKLKLQKHDLIILQNMAETFSNEKPFFPPLFSLFTQITLNMLKHAFTIKYNANRKNLIQHTKTKLKVIKLIDNTYIQNKIYF